jgi:hypothetical protein
MNGVAWLLALTAATLLGLAQTAHAHGIAGNRYIDGTLGFDDPAVADKAILPLYRQLSFSDTRQQCRRQPDQLGLCPPLNSDAGIYCRWRMGSSKLDYWPHLGCRQS